MTGIAFGDVANHLFGQRGWQHAHVEWPAVRPLRDRRVTALDLRRPTDENASRRMTRSYGDAPSRASYGRGLPRLAIAFLDRRSACPIPPQGDGCGAGPASTVNSAIPLSPRWRTYVSGLLRGPKGGAGPWGAAGTRGSRRRQRGGSPPIHLSPPIPVVRPLGTAQFEAGFPAARSPGSGCSAPSSGPWAAPPGLACTRQYRVGRKSWDADSCAMRSLGAFDGVHRSQNPRNVCRALVDGDVHVAVADGG